MTMPLEWAYPEPLLLPCQSITDPTDNPVSTITAKMDFQWIARTNESKIFEFYIIQKSPALSGDELLSKNIYFLILNMTKPPPLLKLDILPLNMGFYDTKNVYKSFSAPQVVYTWLSGIGNKYCLLAHAIEPNSDVDCHALCNFYASNPKYCHRYGTGMEIDTVETYNRFATNNMSDCIEKFLIPLCKFPNVRDLSDDNMMESEYPLEDQQPTLLKNVEPSAFACRGSAPGGDYVVCRMSQLKDKWFYSSYQVCKYYLEHKGEHWTSSVVSIAASDDDTSAGGGAKYYVTYEICKVVVNASNFLKCHELGNKNCPKLPDLQFYPIENQKMHSNYILYSFCCPNRSSTKSNIKPSNDTIPDGVILSDERHAQGLASMPDIYHSPKDKDNTGAKLHDSIMNDVKQSQIQNNTILSAKHQTSISIDISNTLSGGILYVPIYGSEVAPTYIKETCIYSEWEEWSACELPCQLKNKVVNRRRRRTLLQGIGTKCHTIETEPCQDIPDCSSMCLMSEWSEWSKCKVDKENGLSYSVRHILYDSDKCKDQTLELWRSCKDADLDEYTTKDSYDLNLAINELEFAGNMDKEYDITNDYKMAVSSTWSGCTQPCDNRNNRGVNISLKDSERSTNTINTRSCTEKFPPCAFDEVINCEEIRPVLPGLTKQSCISGCRTILSNCKTDHLKCYAFAELGSKQDKNFFNNCRLNDELEKKIAQVKNLQYNKCYISRASYLVDENSWIDARYNACNCYEEGAVPCDEQDVFLSLEDLPEDMMASSVCPVEALAPSEMNTSDMVSFGHNKAAYCPLEYMRKGTVTFGSISYETLRNFCEYGAGYMNLKNSPRYSLFEYQCPYATTLGNRLDPAVTTSDCIAECNKYYTECKNEITTLSTCLIHSLRSLSKEFNKYKCHLSEIYPLDCDMAYSSSAELSDDSHICPAICKYNKRRCEVKIFENDYNNYKRCLKEKLKTSEMFNNNCMFKPMGRMPGSGFVLCKFPPVDCKYSEWSEWSKCTAPCNRIDNVATRKRMRTLIHPASNYGKPCNSYDSLGTIDIEICKHLPPCQSDKWILPVTVESNPLILDFVDNRDDEQNHEIEWVKEAFEVYPKLKHSSEVKSCKLYKSEKTEGCGCPRGYSPCSLGESIKSPDLITSIKNLCSVNPLAFISFEDDVDVYYYLCNVDMVYAEDELDMDIKRCDSIDSFQYSSCMGNGKLFKPFNFIQFFILGAFASFTYILISALLTNVPKFSHSKQKTD